jgi:2-amino-4-hydroxy-6-hydroxymethyldihydropteridine diphosphokinase
MSIVYLSLGTNLGNKQNNISSATQLIEERIGKITVQSALYSYEPWGFYSINRFLNTAIKVETSLSPHELLNESQEIELLLGRTIKSKNGEYHDRLIDIDILFYDNLIINEPNLIIPHALLEQRLFVLEPLCEIAPDFMHPKLKRSIKELLILLQK